MKAFYHSADLDGHASGAVVKYRYPLCEMRGVNYGQVFPWDTIDPGEQVFLVDFTLQPFDDMLRLASLCDLVWIDHHKTEVEEAELRGFNPLGIARVGMGACALCWEFCFPSKPIPDALDLLARFDVWDHSDERTLPFQYGFRYNEDTRPDNLALWASFFEPGHARRVYETVQLGEVLLVYERRQNAKFCQAYAFETTLQVSAGEWENGPTVYRAICANRGFTNSKLFDGVYDEQQHDVMITFCRLKPPAGKWTVSLYSTKDEVDCGAIARRFGGGGHRGAAGFQCESLPFAH